MYAKKAFSTFLLCIVVVTAVGFAPSTEAAPPAGFQLSEVINSGLSFPTGFEFAPDGRIFILERAGAVRVYKNGALLSTPFVTLPSATTGDRGLTGIVFDPNFASNHYVYFYYTSSADLHNRLVRYHAEGDTAHEAGTVLYETLTPSQLLHIGGTVRFGPDGKIYLSIGDNGTSGNSQDLSTPFGKIIRLNPDGSVPADNPFVGQAGKRPEIWAYGLRNPFRFQFDPLTGEMFAGDVGQESWEEINHIMKGHNYGWPLAEGNCSGCGFENPLYTYVHNGQSSSVTGGPVYRGGMFPAEYSGSLFFGDYARGFLKRLTFSLDDHGGMMHAHLEQVFDFDPAAGSVVDLKTAGDGSLYYLTIFPGRLYRLSHEQSNQAPSAQASADVTGGLAPLTVHFSSAGSTDPDGDPLTFLWNFGDGTTSTQANPTKIYNDEGAFVVDLTVSDGSHQSSAAPIIVQVGTPPTLVIGAPTDGDTFRAGDTIAYAAHATDAAGFDLPEQNFTLEVRFHHGTHIHPFLGPITSQSGEFVIPDSGAEPTTDASYEVIFTATDSKGLSTTDSVSIFPELSSFGLATNPAGGSVFLDGMPMATPANIPGVINYQRELEAPIYQKIGGVYQKFSSWSDSGARVHTITTPEIPATFTANYTPVSNWVAEYYDDRFLTPPVTLIREETAVDFDWMSGGPGGGMPVDNFSARFTKTQNFGAGTYRFTARADDGIRVFVDGAPIIDKWFDQGPTTYNADLGLTAGNHTVIVEYFENGGGAVAEVSWVQLSGEPPPPPPPPPPGDGYNAEYWNAGTGGSPAMPTTAANLTRTDPEIDFDWGGGGPGAPINIDHFIARWTRTIDFAEGTYRFTTRSDDGVRVYVDGVLVINQWNDHGPTVHTGDIALTAGAHLVKVEFYENGGGAVAEMSYAPTGAPPAATWNAQYFSNQTLSGSPTVTRTESAIDFNWGGGSPDAAIPVDHFSARFTRTKSYATGTYQFTATADDGVRVFVDGDLVIDHWVDQPPTTYSANHFLTEGEHAVVVEYYENGGGAVVREEERAVESPLKTFDVSGINYAFSVTEIRVNLGERVKINFSSAGGFHDWVLDGYGVGTPRVSAGATTSVEFLADTPGAFEYFCSVGSHRILGMVGTLIVE